MTPPRLARAAGLAALVAAVSTSCIMLSQRVESRALGRDTVTVATPVRAHLLDGSIVVYRGGVRVLGDTVRGHAGGGMRYTASLADSSIATPIPLDSVVGMENYTTKTNTGQTVLLSTLGTGLTALAAAGLAVAAFGSCPTLYADSAGTPVLQAEVFANRISPLFEARDVDRLRVLPGADGVVRLEVRNEALETHYINHLELVEVRHTRGERVYPDERGRPVAVRTDLPIARATDRAGRDLRRTVAAVDGVAFSTTPARLAAVTRDDYRDHIDLTLARPPGADSVVLLLNLRNSLLNTVLLYDMMLAAPGARSLAWLGHDLTRIGPVLALGKWYNSRFGLRVLVRDGGEYRTVARHATYGPVAWRDVATVVPAPPGDDSVHIRLEFVADEWRIDAVRVAGGIRRPSARTVPARDVVDAGGATRSDVLRGVHEADEHYLQTSPGQRMTLSFDVGPAPAADSARTLLLGSQGYYTEWVRGRWIKDSPGAPPFQPSDDALVETIHRWRATQDSLDRHFYSSKVPVR